MQVAAGHTDHPPQFVRKWYQARYASKDDGLAKVADDLRKKGAMPPELMSLNQLQFGNDEMGGVAALDFGATLSMSQLKDRLEKFVKTGDMSALGSARYVYYEKNEKGGTRFLTVWTDDKFNLYKVMPTDRRDAEGSDFEDVPRYPGTVRVLSAEERGMPQRVAVYDGAGSPDAAEMFYRARMQTLGWRVDDTFARLAKKKGHTSLRFENAKGHEV